MACFLPAFKEFNLWLYTKLLYKVAGGKTQSAAIEGIIRVGTVHLFALITLLDSKFETQTEYLIMICDCIPNILSCIKIIKLHNQGRQMNDEKNKDVECLVLEEVLELCVQSIFCTTFLMAYFGPNATILGNVFNDYWQFEKVHSLTDKLSNVLTFFVIDVVQGILLQFALYHYCKLNLYEVYIDLLRQYGVLICLRLSNCICLVHNIIVIFRSLHL